ncbi:peptide synthetase [Nesterenkonia sp. MY13]|uniref:Peptide synthetase n=1 Tax=Nesterenkonia sedimenti TaxID=1463632 RepID=A0A7X8TLC1_9MICC|nr:condensation domain-containing protein [Nesterenkonia sedimenti]NLS10472.1 peptide synthetase [Nesterenkonia sedimenti]
MRLTNVSQMQVQPGRLSSYSVRARTPAAGQGAQLPVSFDQNRHTSFGSRPGSWMAVAFYLPGHISQETLSIAWHIVIERHGTLRSVFTTDDDGAIHLNSTEMHPGSWTSLASEENPQALRAVLREHFDEVCQSFAEPSYRLCTVEDPTGTGDRQVIIGADHAHVDAWSLLVLARDIAACAQDITEGRTPGAQLPEVKDFAEHSAELAARPHPPEEITQRWREILEVGGQAMPSFPLDLGDISHPIPEVVEVRDVFDTEELTHVEEHAADHGVRLIAVAVSVMTRLAAELADKPFRAVFPVHSRYDPRWFNSVGWFITNSVLENAETDYRTSYSAVKEAIRLGSYPLGPIMAPYGGMPQEPGMFAMSWLDHRKLPVNVAEELSPQHVSAVIRTDGVMIWFVINEKGLHLRCRYPDTRQARRSMRTWLAGLVYGLRAPLEQLALRG